jgi:hypothetical protein
VIIWAFCFEFEFWQYLNLLLSSSGNNLTGLCVAKYFRKLLGAHVSKCQFDYDLT